MSGGPDSLKLCPMCNADVTEKYKPFCSKRCADRDLARWFSGAYAVPTNEAPEGDEDLPTPANDD